MGLIVSAVPPALSLYCYRATVVGVLDAIRFEANVDFGFHTWRCGQQFRLAGLDINGNADEGVRALRGLIDNKSIVLQILKDASYGQDALAKAWVTEDNGKTVSVNSFMIDKKLVARAKEETS